MKYLIIIFYIHNAYLNSILFFNILDKYSSFNFIKKYVFIFIIN